jgi:flagellar biosynthesis chaperone FliJ
MAFRYRLEVLLRLQRSVEQQEENRLLACASRVASLRAELEALEQLRWARKQGAWTERSDGTPAVFLRFAADWDDRARGRQKEIQEQMKAAEAARLKQMAVYRGARQKREILEGLKDRQESAYTAEQLRALQQSLDEAHLLRSFFAESS